MRKRALRSCVWAAACVLLTALVSGRAESTVLIKRDLRDLARGADQVLLGTVVRLEPYRDSNSIVFTRVTVEVAEVLKGPRTPGELVSFRNVGGTVGMTTVSVPGTPEFHQGERTLVFLSERENVYTAVYGWMQGKFTIRDGVVQENQRPEANFLREVRALVAQD